MDGHISPHIPPPPPRKKIKITEDSQQFLVELQPYSSDDKGLSGFLYD